MLVLIHGEDIVSSRRKLTDLLATVPQREIIRLQGTALGGTGRYLPLQEEELKNACESQSLFADKRVVVIENLFSLRSQKTKDDILAYLSHGEYDASVVVWQDKSVDGRTTPKYFQKDKIFHFPYPKLLFTFLDALGVRSMSETIKLFQKVLESQDPGLVYAMLLRQMRLLIIAKDLGSGGFPPTQKWQAAKLTKQAAAYSLEKLILLYRQLYAIDYKIKSGETPLSYIELINIWLCSM